MGKYSKIQEQVAKYENFFMTGRFGNFQYVNMNNCIEMSFDLVSELTGKNIDQICKEVDLQLAYDTKIL